MSETPKAETTGLDWDSGVFCDRELGQVENFLQGGPEIKEVHLQNIFEKP